MTTCRCGKTVVELICLRCFQAHPGHEGSDPTCLGCIVDVEIAACAADIAAAFRILEEHQRTHPHSMTATALSILERDRRPTPPPGHLP